MKKTILSLVLTFSALQAHANVLGNMQTLAPTPDSLYFQNIHSSMTLASGRFNVGFFTSYVRNEITAYDSTTLASQNFVDYKDTGITYDMIIAWGLTNHFELFYSLPGFIDQKPDSDQTQQHHISKGFNTHRPGFKYNISQDKSGGFAAAMSADIPVTENDPYVGTQPKPIYNLELIYDIRRTDDAFGFNIGYRKRTPGGQPVGSYFFPLRDQLIYSAGYVYGVGTDRRYHFEVYGALPVDKTPHIEAKHVSSFEGLLGFKQRIASQLWWHIGATAELLAEGLAPQFRAYTGLNYYFGSTEKVKPAKAAPLEKPTVPVYEEKVEVADPLRITPESVQMLEAGKQYFQIYGGTAPYKFRLVNSFGQFHSEKLSYTAPTKPGSTVLIVEDSVGNRKEVNITVTAVPKANKELRIQNLEFDFNTANLTQGSKAKMEEIVATLRQIENIKSIVVAGHTDSLGNNDYNQELSIARAQTVAEILVDRLNLEPSQVSAIGYGEDMPITTNETDEGRQQNRRVELKLYYR